MHSIWIWLRYGGLPVLILLLTLLGTARGDDTQLTPADVQTALSRLDEIHAMLAKGTPTAEQLAALSEEITSYQNRSNDCIQTQAAETANITQQLTALGPTVEGESAQESSARSHLKRQQQQETLLLSSCRLLQVSSTNTLNDLAQRQKALLAYHLLTRGTPTPELIQQWLSSPPAPSSLLDSKTLMSRLGIQGSDTLVWLLALALIGLIAGLIRRQRLHQVAPIDPTHDLARAVFQGIGLSLNRYRPGLLICGLWSLYWLAQGSGPHEWPLLAVLSFALFGYQLAVVAIQASFHPPPPARLALPFPPELTRRFSCSLHWLALNALIGLVLLATPIADAATPSLVLVTRSIWGTLISVNLIWTVWLIRRLRGKQGVGVIRVGIAISLIAATTADWAGYRNLADFIGEGVVLTLITLLLAWLVTTLGNDLIDSLDEGRHAWERRLRARLGVTADAFIPGLFWLRIAFQLLIWVTLALALLHIWGLPNSAESSLLQWAGQGVSIGQIRIEPLRILVALLALGLLLSLGSWARAQLDRHLASTRLERSARETAVAMTGYGMMFASALIALSIAGVAFQNLAIIAGALSVGIGFGLQNIVNNFVSGLILLFERPIRTGDWIIVGGVEGYVRRISIRSTQIQTFDRADVIVPNSDLISSSVTNWVLRDRFGRVRVPIGVAYGSDTQLVKETLLRVAKEHPHIIHGSMLVSDPYVLFLSFGDSSLDFELRAFVRDVSQRLTVLSDLNFAIDAAFRKAEIEIPFPQRDLHIIPAQPASIEPEQPDAHLGKHS